MTFYYTFGFGHKNGNGLRLSNRYCAIEALSEDEARGNLWEKRGPRWSMVYDSKEAVGIDKWNLQPIALNDLSPQDEDED